MGVFGVGWVEILLIGAVALVVIAHERIPQVIQVLNRLIAAIHGEQPTSFQKKTMKNSHHAYNDEVIDIEPLPDPPSNAPPS